MSKTVNESLNKEYRQKTVEFLDMIVDTRFYVAFIRLHSDILKRGAGIMNELKIFDNEEFGEIRTVLC